MSSFATPALFSRRQGKKVKGKKVLLGAPSIALTTSRKCTQSTIPCETDLLVERNWLTDKDILCWLNQEPYHMEIDEPSA